MKIEYACMYGISDNVPGSTAGLWSSYLDKEQTIAYIGAKGGRVYWFLIIKPEAGQWNSNRKYFTTEESRAFCERLQTLQLAPSLTWGDIWSRCHVFKMTPLQEGWFRMWQFQRIVIMGDAIRKVSQPHARGR